MKSINTKGIVIIKALFLFALILILGAKPIINTVFHISEKKKEILENCEEESQERESVDEDEKFFSNDLNLNKSFTDFDSQDNKLLVLTKIIEYSSEVTSPPPEA
ncbi:MAG: hypothetical protein ACPGSL_01255 [Vicingaceae bacterium]